MTDKAITGLTTAGTITGAELTKVVQGGNSRKVALSAIFAALAPVGIDGEDGRTVLNGTTVPSDGGDGVDGDFYIRTTNYVIYGPKTAGAWGAGVSLVGPTGADGADGADGLDGTDGTSFLSGSGAPDDVLTGVDGDMYLDYTAYDIYGPKTAGAWGSGTSILGTVGSDGNTVLNGAVNPTTEGVNGDFYLNTSTYTIFGPKAAGIWPSGVSLIGTDGLDGTDGVDGNTILYGTAAPTTEGVDGNFYIRTTTNFIYGPKAGGVWPSGTSLVGPAGTNGNSVRSGTGAPSGGLGVDGDFYIDTAALSFYGPKTAGAWGTPVSLGGGGGGSVAVDEEGTEVIATATRLNFVGSNVTVTDAGGGEATVTFVAVGGAGLPYDVIVGFIASPTSNQVFSTIPVVTAFDLPANLVGSIGRVGTNPAASFVFTIRKNGTTVATVTVSTSGVFTMTTVGGFVQTFAVGDILTAQAPAGVDASISNLVFALKGATS